MPTPSATVGLMGEDEEATVITLTVYREVLNTLIKQYNGRVVDSPGDNMLAEFVSGVDAVQCAVAVQKEIKSRNDELPDGVENNTEPRPLNSGNLVCWVWSRR